MRSIRSVATRSFWSILAFSLVACSLVPSNPLRGDGTAHGLKSFMGVHFGDSFEDVERRYPLGLAQTSPYGAPAYRLEDVSAASIEYRDVIYEFSATSGMQMVVAHFEPSEGPDVYQQLQKTFGAPSSAGAPIEGAASVDALWHLPDGGSVLFSGPFHRVAMLGKDGAALKTDIRLRDEVPEST